MQGFASVCLPMLHRLYAFILVGLLAVTSQANSSQVKAQPISQPPVIDGTISDDEWKEITPFEGLFDSQTGAAYADTGKFWLAYDKDYIYFSARLYESDPKAIRATEYRANASLSGDDFVELDLDLTGSLNAFNAFQMNPIGGTNIRVAGGRAAKREWLGAFSAKSRVLDKYWETEARIPWRVLAIPGGGGRRNVRFNVVRFVAKSQRSFSYVYVPPTDSALTPTWSDVVMPKPIVDRTLKLLPYVYAGADTRGIIANSGLDLKVPITDQVNLVGSINPDFRNIENQILSIDFSRFERLAGETRPFFQEGSTYSNSQIFASQRIGGFDLGVNAYGRLSDKSSFSFINALDFGNQNDTVVNATYDPTANDSWRATLTRRERPGLKNDAYLLRYSKNIGDYNLFLRDMGSQDTALGFGHQWDVLVQYNKLGLFWVANWAHADRGFNPRLGFVPEVDYDGPFFQVGYNKNLDKGFLNDWGVNGYVIDYNHADGSFYRKEANVQAFTTTRPLNVAIVATANLANFEGSKDSLYSINLGFPRGNPYKNFAVRFDEGRQAGIPYHSATVAAAYRVTRQLQLTLRQQQVTYGGTHRQTIFSGNYDLGMDRSISGRLVQSDGETNGYIAYRRSGNEGMEYFLILGDPNAQKYRNSLILKLVVPVEFGRKIRQAEPAHRSQLSAMSTAAGKQGDTPIGH